MIRTVGALLAGAIVWKAVVLLATLASRLAWPAYTAVEQSRIFALDMLFSRLAVGALATLAFGFVAAWVARGEQRIIRLILSVWLTYSVVDHYLVWKQFPIWYHLVYLCYTVPLVLLGGKLAQRAFGARMTMSKAAVRGE
jgi:hypothetical protein